MATLKITGLVSLRICVVACALYCLVHVRAHAEASGNPPPVTITGISPSVLTYGAATLTVTGTGFLPGAHVLIGGSPAQTTFVSSGELTATATLSPVVGQMAEVTVLNSGNVTSNGVPVSFAAASPVVSYEAAFHFLEQSTWGPTPADIQHLQTVGFAQWFNEQLGAPQTVYDSNAAGLAALQNTFFRSALSGPDQLRQRVAFALSQILCVSALKEASSDRLAAYLQVLETDAFSNYYQLLQDITLNPTMGEYLSMADNYLPSKSNLQPNQNYAREFLQLFTIGTYLLNPDGTTQLDGSGQPIATYDDTTIQNFARMFTGWTFAAAPGAASQPLNPPYFGAPMVAWEAYHDTGTKTLLNGYSTLPGQTAEQDLVTAIQNAFNHQNTGPFISLRLIQHLVESNPSPQYVERVANVFANDGTGTRGNLWAVLQAILLDPEARASDHTYSWRPEGGHLREPVLYLTVFLRELNATPTSGNQLAASGQTLGQSLFCPQSVFSYYLPTNLLPGDTSLLGPEFQLMNSATGLAAINWIDSVVAGNPGPGVYVDMSPFLQFGNDWSSLMTAINNAFLAGQMPEQMRTTIQTALGAAGSPQEAVQTALYLTAASPFYMVQH